MLFDMPDCGGCRTCELACGFKHTSAFSYATSSIRVLDKEDQRGHTVLLLEQNEETHFACDGCPELDVPLCVQHCREAEKLTKMLQEFVRTAKPVPETPVPATRT
jgi:Fe-S-cluster-containing hydrogenase component 2